MKLIRFGDPGKEKPGVILPDGSVRDVSQFTEDFDESFFKKLKRSLKVNEYLNV